MYVPLTQQYTPCWLQLQGRKYIAELGMYAIYGPAAPLIHRYTIEYIYSPERGAFYIKKCKIKGTSNSTNKLIHKPVVALLTCLANHKIQ